MLRTKGLGLLSRTLKSLTDNNAIFSRTLFAQNALGMDNYMSGRERTNLQVTSAEKFKAKMEEFVKDENSKNLIFTEDLKNMIHISERSDAPLLVEMIKRFCSQSKEVRFGNFIFGPPVMRFFHYTKDYETALTLFKDESLGGFFDQVITYQILLDLLFKSEQYQEVLDTYDIIKSRQLQGARYPRHVVILAFAACYKLNTTEAFEYSKKLWHEAINSGHVPLRRAATFFAALALKQDQPQIVLEVLSSVKGQNYVSIRALKALSLARLKRYDDVLPILRSVLEIGNPMMNKQTIPRDILDLLKEYFKNNSNKDLQSDFEKILGFLDSHGHIAEDSLDQILTSEIQLIQPSDQQQQQQSQQFGRNRKMFGNLKQIELDRPSRVIKRPGLHELN